jgi:hypothetical protein
MEKFVRHERPFLFVPEGVVFYLSWEPPFNVAYLNSIYPDFLYKQNERNGILDADDGRVGLMQNSAFLKYIFSFYDKNSLSNV